MKKSNTKIYLLAATLTLAACVKEEPTSLPGTGSEVVDGVKLALQVENPSDSTGTAPNGAKVTTDGTNTYWYYDDVTVNGVDYSVGGNQQSQSVTVTRSHGEYYVASVGNVTQNSPNYASSYQSFTVTYPDTYTYSLQGGGRQWLHNMPMIAIADPSASALNFKQLTTLVAVQCSNTTRVPMKMTSIVLEGRQLCGEARASMSYNGTPDISSTTISIPDAWKKVTLDFNGFGSTSVTLQPGETRTFYIPVRPDTFSPWMNVTVNVKYNDPTPNGVLRVVNQNQFDDRPEKTAQFTGSIGSLTLERAQRHKIYLDLRHEKMPDLVDPYFSTGSNSKVYFSYGNLFCISSRNSNGSAPYLGWCLAEVGDWVDGLGTTYPSYDADTRGTSSSWSYNLGTHLFLSWGTSGYNSGAAVYNPVMKQSSTSSNYSSSTNNNTDWGVYSHIGYDWYNPGYSGIKSLPHNPSSVPGWRTPGVGEWNYILVGRPNADAKRGYGKVNGVPGLILLPDNFTMPTFPGASTFHSTFHSCNNTSASALSYSNNTYTTEEWQQMKARGAVFLPAMTKYRNGTNWVTDYIPSAGAGMYWAWTPSGYGADKSPAMRFDPSKGDVAGSWEKGICTSIYGHNLNNSSGMADSRAIWRSYGIYVRLICDCN